uniref:Uncharacterized protein n=1 Tax=Seriola lalandi dorsalis TaxID=1841481 RepID=A0A3B4X5M6_SERLL
MLVFGRSKTLNEVWFSFMWSQMCWRHSGLSSSGSGPNSERGRMELRRVQSLASQPRYGECWARALEHLDTRCKDMTSESQSRIALRFTHCHLSSSGRDFPSCPEGSEVSRCTGGMDVVAFNTYTEFFTHTHSICHFLQSEVWQSRAENLAEHRLTEHRVVFSELSSVSREQQVALSELFNRVSFLQSFLLMEAHSLSSCCYNAAALCTSFLLTSTQRSSRVTPDATCYNIVTPDLETCVCSGVVVDHVCVLCPQELISVYVSVLRRLMVCVGVCVLLCVCVRYKDPVQQSLQVLQQLRETQRGLQEVLQHAGESSLQEEAHGTC